MVHISALARYGETVLADGSRQIYAPENLRAILPYLAATYGCADDVGLLRPILVVDWTGTPLKPADHASQNRVRQLLARDRIKADLAARVAEVVQHTPHL
jgi:hypothetical protein